MKSVELERQDDAVLNNIEGLNDGSLAFTSPEYTQKRVYGLPHESIVVGESKNIFFGKFVVFSRHSSHHDLSSILCWTIS